MQESAREVHVIMNTNKGDQGIVNAKLIGDLLGEGLKDPPPVSPNPQLL